ncbi:MAG: glycosyltransferase family 39 protein [Pseudomonadota bacterium]
MAGSQPSLTLMKSGSCAVEPVSRRELLVVTLLAIAVPLIICPTLLTEGASSLVDGRPFVTVHFWIADHVWSHWLRGQWAGSATDLISYPTITDMRFVGWPLIVVGFLFRLVLPSLLAFNLAFVLLMAAGTLASFALFRRLVGATAPAAVAGLLFGNSSYVLGTIYNGHVYSMFVCWIPLAVLVAHRALSEGRLRDYLGLVLVSTVAVLDNPYHGAVAAGCVCLLALFHGVRPLARARLLRAGVVVVAAACGLALPIPYYMSDLDPGIQRCVHIKVAITGPDCGEAFVGRVGPAEANRALDGVVQQAVDPVALVLPRHRPPMVPAWSGTVSAGGLIRRTIHTVYLGIPLLLLAAFPFIRRRWSSALFFGLAVATVFLVASLGPVLLWDNRPVCVSGRYLWLPYRGAMKLFPFLWHMGGIYRWAIGTVLGVLLLGCAGLNEILTLVRPSLRRIVAVGVGILLLGDVLFLSPITIPFQSVPMERPRCLEWLRSQPQDAAVVELMDWVPTGHVPFVALRPRIFLRQWQHGHPVARHFDEFNAIEPRGGQGTGRGRPGTGGNGLSPLPNATVNRILRSGAGWLLLSGADAYDPDLPAFAKLIRTFGPPSCTCSEGAVHFVVFRIPEEPEKGAAE